MLTRVFDANAINKVLNHPSVRSDASENPLGHIDIAQGVANTNNVLLLGEYGGCFFIKLLPGIYEVHTQAVSEGRGTWIAEATRECADWMFTRTDAFEITTRIPVEHVGARRLATQAGMRHEFTERDGCLWRGKRMDCDMYSFRAQDWISSSETFEEPGAAFHEFLHNEAKRLGVTEGGHPPDRVHNRYVGASLEMALHGQVGKGVAFYNRYCLMARHPTISVLSVDPLAIKFDLGILYIGSDGQMRVERPS